MGDVLYGGKKSTSLTAKLAPALKKLDRPFLHAHRLEFQHPVSQEAMAFTAPLPHELVKFLATVQPE